jgi:hypothetical protein
MQLLLGDRLSTAASIREGYARDMARMRLIIRAYLRMPLPSRNRLTRYARSSRFVRNTKYRLFPLEAARADGNRLLD